MYQGKYSRYVTTFIIISIQTYTIKNVKRSQSLLISPPTSGLASAVMRISNLYTKAEIGYLTLLLELILNLTLV